MFLIHLLPLISICMKQEPFPYIFFPHSSSINIVQTMLFFIENFPSLYTLILAEVPAKIVWQAFTFLGFQESDKSRNKPLFVVQTHTCLHLPILILIFTYLSHCQCDFLQLSCFSSAGSFVNCSIRCFWRIQYR